MDHIKDMMIIAYNTGMRPGEVRALRWSYIDWQKGFIEVPPEVTKESAKNAELVYGEDDIIFHDFRRSVKTICRQAGYRRNTGIKS